MLLQPIQGFLLEKCGNKINMIEALILKNGKIVFVLLYKVIVIPVKLTLRNISDLDFKSQIKNILKDSPILAMS